MYGNEHYSFFTAKVTNSSKYHYLHLNEICISKFKGDIMQFNIKNVVGQMITNAEGAGYFFRRNFQTLTIEFGLLA